MTNNEPYKVVAFAAGTIIRQACRTAYLAMREARTLERASYVKFIEVSLEGSVIHRWQRDEM